MARILFIKSNLEVDAAWDPLRTCNYIGIWAMASLLKERGHQVQILDEIVRDGGLGQKVLFTRELDQATIVETPLAISYDEFQQVKMADFQSMTPEQFVGKYSAFQGGKVVRTIARIGQPIEATLAKIAEFAPDVIGIPLIASANYLPSTRLAMRIREEFPRVKILFGGQHISAEPERFLQDNPFVDQIVVGDAIGSIEGMVTGQITDRIVIGGCQSLASFPLLDPSLVINAGYPADPMYSFPTSGRRYIDYMFSKGCFRDCGFCYAGSNDSWWSTTGKDEKQLDRFVQEGVGEIIFQDDAFLHRAKEYLQRRMQLLKSRGLWWQNNGGLDFESMTDWVTDQFIEYNASGEGRCTALYIPFNPRDWNRDESASASMVGKYHRNLENLKRLREAGIFVFTSAIIGTPEMTDESFKDELSTDRRLVEEGYIDLALPLSATMLPGTRWYRDNGRNIVAKYDWAGYSLFTTHHQTEQFTPRGVETRMIRWYKEMSPVQSNPFWGCAFPS